MRRVQGRLAGLYDACSLKALNRVSPLSTAFSVPVPTTRPPTRREREQNIAKQRGLDGAGEEEEDATGISCVTRRRRRKRGDEQHQHQEQEQQYEDDFDPIAPPLVKRSRATPYPRALRRTDKRPRRPLPPSFQRLRQLIGQATQGEVPVEEASVPGDGDDDGVDETEYWT